MFDEEAEAKIEELADEMYAGLVDDRDLIFFEGGIVRTAPTGAPNEYIVVEIEGIYDQSVMWRGMPASLQVGDEVLVWENPITHRREVWGGSGTSTTSTSSPWQKVTVAVAGGDFALLSAAITWINALPGGVAPSATRLFAINMLGGTFVEGANITVPQYVHVDGEGEGTVLDLGDFELGMAADTSIANIVVTSTGDDGNVLMQVSGNNVTMRNVRLILTGAGNDGLRLNTYTGIELYHVTLEATAVGGTAIYCDGATALLWDVKADDTTNWGTAALYLDNGAVVTTKFCEFHAAADDVLTIAGTAWSHFVTNFDPANSTIGGAETALTHGLTNFVDGIEFTGATTLNIITVPDNFTQAMNWVDTGGLELMRTATLNAGLGPSVVFFPSGGGKVGVGAVPGLADGMLHVENALAALVTVESTGAVAGATMAYLNDAGSTLATVMYGSAAPGNLFGLTRNDLAALWSSGADALAMGTNDAVDFILGTNDVERFKFSGAAGAITVSGPSMTVPDGWTLGQAAGPLITFDDAGNDLEITGCFVLVDFDATGLSPAVDFHVLRDQTSPAFYLTAYKTAPALPTMRFQRARGTAVAPLVVANNDLLGAFIFQGYSTAAGDFRNAAALYGYVDGIPDSGGDPTDMPGRLEFQTTPDGSATLTTRVVIDNVGHTYPGSNKAQDLGLTGSRWREIFCSLALNTGTSRLVPVKKNCAVDGAQLVRSTGGLRVTGEESDFLLAFCPDCGTVAMEELKHRIAPATKDAPKVVLTGVEVLKSSGNTKSVVVNFRYGDDEEDEMGIQRAPHNSTTLSDDELAVFPEMTDEQRRAFLLDLGRIEWDALEKMEVIGPELDDEQAQIDLLIRDLIGEDLLKGGTGGTAN